MHASPIPCPHISWQVQDVNYNYSLGASASQSPVLLKSVQKGAYRTFREVHRYLYACYLGRFPEERRFKKLVVPVDCEKVEEEQEDAEEGEAGEAEEAGTADSDLGSFTDVGHRECENSTGWL